jgi:hypothetical protein
MNITMCKKKQQALPLQTLYGAKTPWEEQNLDSFIQDRQVLSLFWNIVSLSQLFDVNTSLPEKLMILDILCLHLRLT